MVIDDCLCVLILFHPVLATFRTSPGAYLLWIISSWASLYLHRLIRNVVGTA